MLGEHEALKHKLAGLHADWTLTSNQKALSRQLNFSGFNDGLSIANVCGALASRENHHPDITLGWGYCVVKYTTHSSGDITERDFNSAGQLDQLLALLGYS